MIAKNILLTVFVLINLSAFAQDIKTKKDKILFDKKEIAQFEKKKNWYTISDLEGNMILKVKPNLNTINEHNREIYYEVSSPDDMVAVSIFNKSNKSPLSLEKKFLVDFTLGEYKLFTENGIDLVVAKEMLNSNSNVKEEILRKAKAIDDEEKRVMKLITTQGITFNDKLGEDGAIIRNRVEIGCFVRKRDGMLGVMYELYRYDKNDKNQKRLIGVWYGLKSNANIFGDNYPVLDNELVLINKEKIGISGLKKSTGSRVSMDNLALIFLGYALDHKLL